MDCKTNRCDSPWNDPSHRGREGARVSRLQPPASRLRLPPIPNDTGKTTHLIASK